MTTPYRKKLIEVALPLKAINEASAREKSIRHGQPVAATVPKAGTVTTPGVNPNQTGSAPKLSRFHGSVKVDPLRLGRDTSRIAEEVVQHLTGLVGSEVEITIEISADLADGASDKIVRDVTENCRTLKFTDFGFEED